MDVWNVWGEVRMHSGKQIKLRLRRFAYVLYLRATQPTHAAEEFPQSRSQRFLRRFSEGGLCCPAVELNRGYGIEFRCKKNACEFWW